MTQPSVTWREIVTCREVSELATRPDKSMVVRFRKVAETILGDMMSNTIYERSVNFTKPLKLMKSLLVFLPIFTGSSQAVNKFDVPSWIIREWKYENFDPILSGGYLITLKHPKTGELLDLIFKGNGDVEPLNSITLSYKGYSNEFGYPIGVGLPFALFCLSQKDDISQAALRFLEESLSVGVANGGGKFQKTFGRIVYTATTKRLQDGKKDVSVNLRMAGNFMPLCDAFK